MLNAKSLKEFKEIWKKEKGEEISDDFAIEYSEKLLSLFNLIYRPIPKTHSNETKNI